MLKIVKSVSHGVSAVTNGFMPLSYGYRITKILTFNTDIMKALKAMMIGLALMAVCGFANATTKTTNDVNTTKQEVLDTYMNALVHGNLDGISAAIDDNAKFYVVQGVRVHASDKKQVLDYLKSNANIDQNCKCSSSTLSQDDNTLVQKVEMKFKEITRTDVITAQRSDDGWKITKVETSFK